MRIEYLPADLSRADCGNQKLGFDRRLLFETRREPIREAADPNRLGDRIDIQTVLHTWGSAMMQRLGGFGVLLLTFVRNGRCSAFRCFKR
jgi:hypothetical protein